MADPRLPVGVAPEPSTANRSPYRIMRKGSRYNIPGPDGRIFGKYKSASVAGPLWEELTHRPWPHDSTAYERRHRSRQSRPANAATILAKHTAWQAQRL